MLARTLGRRLDLHFPFIENEFCILGLFLMCILKCVFFY